MSFPVILAEARIPAGERHPRSSLAGALASARATEKFA
jgi:hypothetical protein